MAMMCSETVMHVLVSEEEDGPILGAIFRIITCRKLRSSLAMGSQSMARDGFTTSTVCVRETEPEREKTERERERDSSSFRLISIFYTVKKMGN